ncbi:MAG: histone deacetylase [Actinomycetota bacterium]
MCGARVSGILRQMDGGGSDEDLVWYVSYGSNLDRDRLICYLEGGTARDAHKANVGARDPRPPRADRPFVLGHELFFADVSHVWTGGVAFVDHHPDPSVRTLARAFLLTADQLCDVVAQESARPLGSIQLTDHVEALDRDGRAVVGPGRYDTLLDCGELEGRRCVTFTGRSALADTEIVPPAGVYLSMVADGLRAAHRLDDRAIVEYLRDRPGVVPTWSDDALAAAIRPDSPSVP